MQERTSEPTKTAHDFQLLVARAAEILMEEVGVSKEVRLTYLFSILGLKFLISRSFFFLLLLLLLLLFFFFFLFLFFFPFKTFISNSIINSFVRSFVHLFTHSFIYSFILSILLSIDGELIKAIISTRHLNFIESTIVKLSSWMRTSRF